MRVGFGLGNIGPIGTPDNIARIAQRAEALGYDTLWTVERLLSPVKPQSPYPVTPDGSLPAVYRHVLDPLDSLSFVAALTKKIGLGTSVLDIPYYNPVMLARQITTLDVLSGGRVRLGLGLGWSKDEHDAVGVEMKNRGARAEEFLKVLKAIWTADPAEFKGQYYTLPKSHIGPKPVQKPHPPVYMAAFVPAAMNRIARLANGWYSWPGRGVSWLPGPGTDSPPWPSLSQWPTRRCPLRAHRSLTVPASSTSAHRRPARLRSRWG